MSKIRELLNDKEAVLVFDVDGVLAPLEWGEYNHFGEDDATWDKMYQTKSTFYTEEFVSKKMQDFLKDKDKSRIYVITKVFNENESEDKRNFVSKYYGIPRDHLYGVRDNMEKMEILKKIKSFYPDLPDYKLAMIDDTVTILTHIMDNTNFSTIHISSFLE